MMRVLIADDEPIALRRLTGLLEGLAGIELVGVAVDGVEAAGLIREASPDVAILDIEMPGLNGLALARTLGGLASPQVIFATAFGHYAPDAFEIDATDYLLKPVTRERLAQALRRADHRRQGVALLTQAMGADGRRSGADSEWANEVWVPIRGGQARLTASEIVWVEGAGDYVILHTASRGHMLRATMTSLEGRFDPSILRRVHRSAMVNLGLVSRIRRRARGDFALVLRDDSEAPVGASYAADLLETLGLKDPPLGRPRRSKDAS